jgi:hypothetical protein
MADSDREGVGWLSVIFSAPPIVAAGAGGNELGMDVCSVRVSSPAPILGSDKPFERAYSYVRTTVNNIKQ